MPYISIITKISNFIKEHTFLRLLYYALVIAALIYVAVTVKTGEIAFVYNEF